MGGRPLGTEDAPVVRTCQRLGSIRSGAWGTLSGLGRGKCGVRRRPQRPSVGAEPALAQAGLRRAWRARRRRVSEAGNLPIDGLIELEFRWGFEGRLAPIRSFTSGQIPVESLFLGWGTSR